MPNWLTDWFVMLNPAGQIILIIVIAWVVLRIGIAFLHRAHTRYQLPVELVVVVRRSFRFIVYASTLLLILERFGVSGTMLWGAFTGFAAVAAVAFFAAWSVLSNIFCAMMIFATRLFRIGDHIELIESSDKPGLKGRVVDINLISTTLLETEGGTGQPATVLRIPNNMFFQRVLRRAPAYPTWTDRFTTVTPNDNQKA